MSNKYCRAFVYAAICTDASLRHHGIPNMHWGVRNGPPYPLDKKVSAAIRSGKNEKARHTKKELKDLRKHPQKDKKVGITHLGNPVERFFPEVNRWYSNGATTGLEGRTYAKQFDNVASVIGRGEGDWIRRLDRPGHKATMDDAYDCNWQRQRSLSNSNGRYDPGLNNNCGKCSATMFLRGLGYDVQAGRANNTLISAPEYWFDGAKPYKEKGAANIYRTMSGFGNQGKGVLSIRRPNGSGHAVYFQNEKGSDGKTRPVIYDGQVGARYASLSQFLKAEGADTTQFTTITRLDGSTPNWKHLAEDSVCRMNFANKDLNWVRVDNPKRSDKGTLYRADNMRFN